MRDECLSRAVSPSLNEGDIVRSGFFWRNLRDDDVRKRYSKDGRPLEYGLRIRFNKLYSWYRHPYRLSVNISTCADAQCAVHLHSNPNMFKYVGLLDLGVLVEMLGGFEVVAIYKPERIDPKDDKSDLNPCHFDLCPDGTFDMDEFVSALGQLEWHGFPPEVRGTANMPANEEQKKAAKQAQAELDALINLVEVDNQAPS